MEEVILLFPAKIKFLHIATTLCRELCSDIENHKIKKGFIQDVELCISEACTNAIKYGSRDNSANTISLGFQIHTDKIIIREGVLK